MTKNPENLLAEMDALMADVHRQSINKMTEWTSKIGRARFSQSAENLASYLALRDRDLRSLQRSLTELGLSSLGRLESRVMPTLQAVRSALAALSGATPDVSQLADGFFDGEVRLVTNAAEIFGSNPNSRQVALLVTCPSEAADEPDFMLGLATKGVEAVRINCAHDSDVAWLKMIENLRAAETATGQRMKVFMDLAGPKIRTGKVRHSGKKHRKAREGDLLAIARTGDLADIDLDHGHFALECTLPEALDVSLVGDHIFIDDGKLAAIVERKEPWGLVAKVTNSGPKGLTLKPEKGINFPDRHLDIDALTEKDRKDLVFISAHADAIEYSFVQSADDVAKLQNALAALRPDDWRKITLVLKIETARAVANLPEIIIQSAGQQPTAIMIARGDLAVEIGFSRTAEIQEEILWLGEAADIPVIWATQVLEGLVSKGLPSRGEMTDAAMAARAECVMLNKGPQLLAAIDQLQTLLNRMNEHQHKKTPQLRALKSWHSEHPQ